MKQVKIFTDGSCLGNPGPGGYGVLISYNNYKKFFSKGYFYTTNNRMELMGAIFGLEILQESCNIILTTDSQYLKNGITKWIKFWKINNWKRKNKSPVLNSDLWKRLDKAKKKHKIFWRWIKGHAGNIENNQCDKIAKIAANYPSEKDIYYY